MLGREYFENVLKEQLQSIGQSVTLKVQIQDGRQLEVWNVFAAHDRYVILEIYPARPRAGSSETSSWRERYVFDCRFAEGRDPQRVNFAEAFPPPA